MIQKLNHDQVWLTREVANAFFNESGIEGELNFSHFCQQWGNFISLDMGAIFVYLDDQEDIVGIIGGLCFTCPMTADLIAQEAFWWVATPIRGTAAGVRLLKAWEKWAKDKGSKRLYVGNLHRLNSETMMSMYLRMGYRPTEIHYVKKS